MAKRRRLEYPGVQLLALTPEIAIEPTQLPGEFHRDPQQIRLLWRQQGYIDVRL